MYSTDLICHCSFGSSSGYIKGLAILGKPSTIELYPLSSLFSNLVFFKSFMWINFFLKQIKSLEWRLEWMGHWMSPWIWSSSTFRTIAWLSLVFSSCACILPTVSTYGWLWSTQGCELTQMKFKNHLKSINLSNLWKVNFNVAHKSTTVIWSEKVRFLTCSFIWKGLGWEESPWQTSSGRVWSVGHWEVLLSA